MNWMELVGSQAILLLVFGFVARRWFIARIEGSIGHEYAEKLAEVNARLDVLSSEKKYVFEQRHQREIEVLSETYGRLWYAASMANSYMSPGNGSSEFRARNEELDAAWKGFNNYFNQKRLWLPQDAAEMVERIRKLLWDDVLAPFQVYIVYRCFDKERKEQLEQTGKVWLGGTVSVDSIKWGELRKKLDEEIFPAIAELETDFRKRLNAELVGQEVTK